MPKTLDREAFEKDLKAFVEKSDEIFDGWTLKRAPDRGGGLYAEKRCRQTSNLQMEHHILYCPSYQVPVIYFRLYDSSGQLVSDVETVLRTVTPPPDRCESLLSQRLESLTQMPHPIHQTPFLQIHPCKTAEWMESVFVCSTNYILSWLSYVGPNVGIYLDNHYFD